MTTLEIKAAYRKLNCKLKGDEWYKLVYRDGKWEYIGQPLPKVGQRGENRDCESFGHVTEGEIIARHPRGGQVDRVQVVQPGPDGKLTLVDCHWAVLGSTLLVRLPDETELKLPNPRK
jgi:hypothetical protein